MTTIKKYLLLFLMAIFTFSLSSGIAVTANAEGETPEPSAAFSAFKAAVENAATDGSVTEIALTEDFTVTEAVALKSGASYVIYSDTDVTVTLGENMLSQSMFTLAEDAKISLVFGKTTKDAGTVTYNGNKAAFAGNKRTGSGFLTIAKSNEAANGNTVIFNRAIVKDFVNTANGTVMSVNAKNTVVFNGGVFEGNEKRNIDGDLAKQGIIYLNGCTVTVNGGEFRNNLHEGTGGSVIYLAGASSLTVNGGSFADNRSSATAKGKGYGAIYVNHKSASLNVYGGEFKNNYAQFGGAIAVVKAKSVNIDGTQEGKTLSFQGNSAYYLGGDIAVFGNVTCAVSGVDLQNSYMEKTGKVHLMYDSNELTVTQASTDDLYSHSEGLGNTGSFLYTDGDNYMTYRAVYPAGARNVGFAMRLDGGIKAEYRNIESDTYFGMQGLVSGTPAVWQTYRIDPSVLNENKPTVIEVKFSDPTPADGGGTQVHDFRFLQGKVHVLTEDMGELAVRQGNVDDLYSYSNGIGNGGTFLWTDADNYLTYRAVYPAGTKSAGISFRITGGGLKAEYRNVKSDEYTEIAGLSGDVSVWQTFFIDNAVMNEGEPTEIEVRFSDPTPTDGGGTQVHDFMFVKVSSTGKETEVNVPRASVNLIDDISEGYSYGNAGGKPFADGYAYYSYCARYPAGSRNAGMILTVGGAQENIYVGYSVNGGEFTELNVVTGQEGKFLFEGLEENGENVVIVKFYAKLKAGSGPYLQSLVFIKEGKTHAFGNETVLDLGNSAENLYDDTGSAVAGPVRYVDGNAFMTYRVTFPEGTKIAKALLVVGGTNADAGESPKAEYRNIESETYTAATLVSDLGIQQTIDFGGILNVNAATTIEVRISDPSPENGGGTQLMGITFRKNVANDKLLVFAENETDLGVDLMKDIDEGFDYGNAANTPFADCAAFYSYRVEYPANAYAPFVKLTVNGGNAEVYYTVNGGNAKEIVLESAVEKKTMLEGFIAGQKNVLVIVFGAKDKTQGSGANLKAIGFGFTDGETVIEGISLDKESAEIEEDRTLTLVPTVTGGSKIDATVTWASSDETVATVKNGVVTAKKAGSVIITATAADGKTASCTITVKTKKEPAESGSSAGEESGKTSGGCLSGIGGAWLFGFALIAALAAVKKAGKENG